MFRRYKMAMKTEKKRFILTCLIYMDMDIN